MPVPFCTLFAGFGSTNKSATSLLLLPESRSVLFSIFSFTVISLTDLAGSVFSLLLFHQATMGPRILGNDAADELARRRALLVPSVIPCSLSSFISRIHSSLFSDWRCTVSSKFFNTQVSSFSTEELVLPCHARCVLSRLRCNGHSLLISLGLPESRILPAAPADTVPEHFSSHSALSSYGIFAALALW